MITIRFFATLKRLAGAGVVEYDIKAPLTVAELKDMSKKERPALTAVLDSRSVLISVNQEIASMDTVIEDGDEVGFLPPFSGG